jgi:hypothetical protein
MEFTYHVVTPKGVLVTTMPTLQDAVKKANQYGAVVLKRGHVVYRSKTLLSEKGA